MVETGSRILHLADLYEAATQGPPLNEPRAQADAYADLYRYVVTRADAAWVAGRVAGTLTGFAYGLPGRRPPVGATRGSASRPRERWSTQAVRVRRPRRLRAAFATPLTTLRAAHTGACAGATSLGRDSTTTCFQAENTCCGRVPVT